MNLLEATRIKSLARDVREFKKEYPNGKYDYAGSVGLKLLERKHKEAVVNSLILYINDKPLKKRKIRCLSSVSSQAPSVLQ